jgi:hypothetical protein
VGSPRSSATAASLVVTVEGFEMPGRSCAPVDADERYENVHVGVQRRNEVVDLIPGDAQNARWRFEVTVRALDDGTTDFAGPFVHGRRGDRFLYLSWGAVGTEFRMFRRAKLHFADCDTNVLAAALRVGEITCRVRMSDPCGAPRCGRVRPPDAEWSAP